MHHPNSRVAQAIHALNDALCEHERHTGRQNVLIIRDTTGWSHRSMNGKPVTAPVTDAQLWLAVEPYSEDD